MIKKLICFTLFVNYMILGVYAQQNSPKEVLHLFISLLSKQDVAKARLYATKDSKAMLDMIEMGINMVKAQAKKSGKELPVFSMRELEIGQPFIRGDYAVVNTKAKVNNETVAFTLYKENGEWKVVFNQATLAKMAADKGIDVNQQSISKPKQ